MKSISFLSAAPIFLWFLLAGAAAAESVATIPNGSYSGYAETYDFIDGAPVRQSCDTLGTSCEIVVSDKGITFLSKIFEWDLKGFQASRKMEDGTIVRINCRGRFGPVFVVDVELIDADANPYQKIRMCVAQHAEAESTKNSGSPNP